MEHHHDGPGAYRHIGHLRTRKEDLVAVVDPFVRQALAAGDRVVIACPERVGSAFAGRWSAGDDVVSIVTAEPDRRPAVVVAELGRLINRHLPGGGRRLRLVTAVDAPSCGWTTWMATEALFNHVLADRPVDQLCLLGPATDAGAGDGPGPGDVARAVHPFLLTAAGVVTNPDAREPAALLTELQRSAVPDPLEETEPLLTLTDLDDVRTLRRCVHEALAASELDRDTIEDFVLAINEIAANAAEHGVPPIDVRLWCGHDRLLCSITDRGPCFDDPLAGYGPAHGDMAVGGMGLWLARRSVDTLVAGPAEDGEGGCTVRLAVNA